MFERDYTMRLIREFFAALQRLLEKNEIKARHEALIQLYGQYVGPYALFHNASVEEVLLALGGTEEDKRIAKMEMLAELYHAEAGMVSSVECDMLLNKAYALFEIVERQGRTFSVARRDKMNEIKSMLDSINTTKQKQ